MHKWLTFWLGAGLVLLLSFQNCSGPAGFKTGGDSNENSSSPVYANGDGHEGKLSVPIDYVQANPDAAYQDTVFFDINGYLNSQSSLNEITLFCRSENSSRQEGVDLVLTLPQSQWRPDDEVYSFEGSIAVGASFTRPGFATQWRSDGTMGLAPANTPRFVERQGVRSLLLESDSTNLLLQSGNFDVSSAWNLVGAEEDPSQSPILDQGLTTILTEVPDTTGEKQLNQAVSLNPSETYTLSWFVKDRGTNRNIAIGMGELGAQFDWCLFNITPGSVMNPGVITAMGSHSTLGNPPVNCHLEEKFNGWFRIGITLSASEMSNPSNSHVALNFFRNQSDFEYVVDQSLIQNIEIFGAQLEVGGEMTSYIPTLNASRSRGRDNLRIRRQMSALSQASFSVDYEIEENAQLDLSFQNAGIPYDVTLDRNDLVIDTPSGPIFFPIPNGDGTNRVNVQFESNEFLAFSDGRFIGREPSNGFSISEVDFNTSDGRIFLRQVTVKSSALLEEVLSVSSIENLDVNSGYAVLLMGRDVNGHEKLQTQPIPVDIASGQYYGRDHFLVLSPLERLYRFQTSLEDGTLIDQNMLCSSN